MAPLLVAVLGARPRARHVRDVGLGLVGGALAFPGVVLAVMVVGFAVGLEPGPRRAAPADPRVQAWALVAAPLLEEALYRGWLLPALAARVGAAVALVASSACFALPHLAGGGGWAGLATLVVGLGLGGAFLASRSLALCVGLHAGLNAVALLRGVP